MFTAFATKVAVSVIGMCCESVRNLQKCVSHKKSYIEAHRYSNNNMDTLKRESRCGCFQCLAIFDPSEIEDWIIADNPMDQYGTAICPFCGVDSIITESVENPITIELLRDMRKYWFGF